MSKRTLITMLLILLPLGAWWVFSARPDMSAQPQAPQFALYVKQPKPAIGGPVRVGTWNAPIAVASIDNRLFVLDSGNDRILELDSTGNVISVLCEAGECQFSLKSPQAIAAHDGQLYVANTGAGQVVVLNPGGSLIETIGIRIPDAPEGERVSPNGIALNSRGDIYVADSKRNLVLRLSGSDRVWSISLSPRGESQKYRAINPAGLAVDGDDNLYVANKGDGTIRMYSPEIRHLQEFSMRTNPTYFSPIGVAVDPSGDVYFTDERGRVIYVYSPGGDLVGTVGLLDATRVDSPAVLRDPQGIYWHGNTLYVADRTAGLFGFQIDATYWSTRKPSGSWSHP